MLNAVASKINLEYVKPVTVYVLPLKLHTREFVITVPSVCNTVRNSSADYLTSEIN